jgi:16S rRNA (adenine1518-N6/adenine1519-N6)-dimethyltransferase
MLVMVQREVAERLAAIPGSAAYGAVSVKVAYWARARIVGDVPATVFVPSPNVESALVDIVRRPPPDVAPEALFPLVRTAFGHRRKMLRRSLAGAVTPDQFVAAGVAETARPETLALDDWVRLARVVGAP